AFKDFGIEVIKTRVGDKYVSEALIKGNLTIGGENSGHIIVNEILPSGDGVFAGMYLLEILTENNMDLKEYTREVEMYPQKMVNIKNVDKNVVKLEEIKQLLEVAQKELTSDSLLLVRPSGTEDLVRVTISCKDESLLDLWMERI